MAKKAKKRAKAAAKASKRPRPARRAPAAGRGERRVPMLLAAHHVRVLEELGRQYGCLTTRGDVALERVLREILDRYGGVLLTVARPRRTVDEEE